MSYYIFSLKLLLEPDGEVFYSYHRCIILYVYKSCIGIQKITTVEIKHRNKKIETSQVRLITF